MQLTRCQFHLSFTETRWRHKREAYTSYFINCVVLCMPMDVSSVQHQGMLLFHRDDSSRQIWLIKVAVGEDWYNIYARMTRQWKNGGMKAPPKCEVSKAIVHGWTRCGAMRVAHIPMVARSSCVLMAHPKRVMGPLYPMRARIRYDKGSWADLVITSMYSTSLISKRIIIKAHLRVDNKHHSIINLKNIKNCINL